MSATVMERINRRTIEGASGCHLWTGAVDRGYGRIYVDGSARRVHRVIWELCIGPIPDEMTIDHLCRVRNCINLEHLEVVTLLENIARKPQKPRAPKLPPKPRVRRTHCLLGGHEFTAENTMRSGSKRRCRTCRRAYMRAYMQEWSKRHPTPA